MRWDDRKTGQPSSAQRKGSVFGVRLTQEDHVLLLRALDAEVELAHRAGTWRYKRALGAFMRDVALEAAQAVLRRLNEPADAIAAGDLEAGTTAEDLSGTTGRAAARTVLPKRRRAGTTRRSRGSTRRGSRRGSTGASSGRPRRKRRRS
jgi:hypothetical protein